MTATPTMTSAGSRFGSSGPILAEPDRRSRRDGLVPVALMAVVVAGPTALIAGWLLWMPDAINGPGGWRDVLTIAAGPALLLGLLVVPSLLLGRRPGG